MISSMRVIFYSLSGFRILPYELGRYSARPVWYRRTIVGSYGAFSVAAGPGRRRDRDPPRCAPGSVGLAIFGPLAQLCLLVLAGVAFAISRARRRRRAKTWRSHPRDASSIPTIR